MDTVRKPKMLVIDDVKANLVLMSALLKAASYDVATSLTGVRIMQLIETEHPDVVLLDVMMAGMDGLEVLRVIRTNEATKNLPVIMVSAFNNPETIAKAYALGANDYITKPIILPQLIGSIKKNLAS